MHLACNDVVPGIGCEFVAVGDDASEVHAAMMAHSDQVHSALVDGMTPDAMSRAKDEMENHIFELLDHPGA